MSRTRHFPVYVVRLPNNEGCGHQHDTDEKAWHCANTIARRRKSLAWIQVVRISQRMTGQREVTIGQLDPSTGTVKSD